jgi:putative salt-induced outer membrane protein
MKEDREMWRIKLYISLLLLGTNGLSYALAQDPAQEPEKVWSGSAGAGLSLTTGNTDTTDLNLSFEAVRDPKTRNLIKFGGLYIRGKADEVVNKDRARLYFRDDYSLTERLFVFGSAEYQRDPFKEIDYIMNPIGGLGYRAYSTDRFQLSFGGGGGGIWEKNTGLDVDATGSLNAGQELEFQLSDTARLTQKLSGLWKTRDLGDALYNFAVALSVSVIKNMEMKVEFLFDHKSKPTSPEILKNDTATLLSFVYKF